MMCPFKLVSCTVTTCEKNACAWWDKDNNCCVIITLCKKQLTIDE